MRFENWDILLFPSSAQVPIQEFKTEAYWVDDLEAPPLTDIFDIPGQQNLHTINSPSSTPSSNDTGTTSTTLTTDQPFIFHSKMPLLSCFVPSLTEASPFRISIHTWEQIRYTLDPKILAAKGLLPCFLVRVLIDGKSVSMYTIRPDTVFPVAIQTTPCKAIDNESPNIADRRLATNPQINRDFLRWPQFQAEQLHHISWTANDNQGRIKVIISEGSLTQDTGLVTRGRNVVTLAFQHAPLQILKNAGIAWPNDGLWSTPGTIVSSPVEVGGTNEQTEAGLSQLQNTNGNDLYGLDIADPEVKSTRETISWVEGSNLSPRRQALGDISGNVVRQAIGLLESPLQLIGKENLAGSAQNSSQLGSPIKGLSDAKTNGWTPTKKGAAKAKSTEAKPPAKRQQPAKAATNKVSKPATASKVTKTVKSRPKNTTLPELPKDNLAMAEEKTLIDKNDVPKLTGDLPKAEAGLDAGGPEAMQVDITASNTNTQSVNQDNESKVASATLAVNEPNETGQDSPQNEETKYQYDQSRHSKP